MDCDECPICYIKNDNKKLTLKCSHIFHMECLIETFKYDKIRNCPYCRSLYPPISCNVNDQFIKGFHKLKVTTDSDKCVAIIKSGKRKGEMCGCKSYVYGLTYCGKHKVSIL